MKTLMLATITLLFSMSSQSQNKNVQETTKTTVTTVTTSEGDKKYTTKENVKEVQNIEMNKEKANTLNIDAKNSPVMVTTTTKVINQTEPLEIQMSTEVHTICLTEVNTD